jgi:hypothetical protein
MFNQFGQARKFTPQTPSRPIPGQTAATTGSPSGFSPQIRPDFSFSAQHTNAQPSGPARRIQPDTLTSLSPQSQRAALYDQARQQAQQESLFTDPRTKLSDMLPGGLTERQRADFKTLQITNPQAALKQLETYNRTSDIRYNKPNPGAQTAPTQNFRRPPTNFSGPRPRF